MAVRKLAVHPGDRATAVFVADRLRMTASVTCLDRGREGEIIRVRGIDGHIFRARISGPARLEAVPQIENTSYDEPDGDYADDGYANGEKQRIARPSYDGDHDDRQGNRESGRRLARDSRLPALGTCGLHLAPAISIL